MTSSKVSLCHIRHQELVTHSAGPKAAAAVAVSIVQLTLTSFDFGVVARRP